MVRLKNRYLLIDILYPDPSTWPSTKPQKHRVAKTQTQHQNQHQKTETTPHLQIHSPTSNALTPSLLAKLIREEVAELYGDWGVGRLGGANAGGVSVKYLSPATSTAIIRCPRASFRLVWSALTYMDRVPDLGESGRWAGAPPPLNRECVFRVVKVSGTMRKAEEEAIRRARREIVRLRGAEEVDVLEGLVGGGDRALDAGEMDKDVDVDVDVGMESDDDDD